MTTKELLAWLGPVRWFIDEMGALWCQGQRGFWMFDGFRQHCNGHIWAWRRLEGRLPYIYPIEATYAEMIIQRYLDEFIQERQKQ